MRIFNSLDFKANEFGEKKASKSEYDIIKTHGKKYLYPDLIYSAIFFSLP